MAFSYDPYRESSEVSEKRKKKEQYDAGYTPSQDVYRYKSAWDAHTGTKPSEWDGGQYGKLVDEQVAKIANREPFEYNLNGDALYQQYRDQYIRDAQLAMQDTMGQAAALTGGYGNSYAATVGNQAYQAYLGKLNDIVPELYQMALDKYDRDGAEMKDLYALYAGENEKEYGRWGDSVDNWYREDERLQNRYQDERNYDRSIYETDRNYYTQDFQDARNFDYSQYGDDYSRAFTNYQQSVSERQANRAIEVDQKGKFYDLYDKAITASTVTRGNRGNTGNGGYDYDGKHYTSYNAAYNAAKNDIADAYNNGYITDAQANKLLDELDRNLKK